MDFCSRWSIVWSYKRCAVKSRIRVSFQVRTLNFKDKIVVDIGAHCWAIFPHCLSLARRVFSIEPRPLITLEDLIWYDWRNRFIKSMDIEGNKF